MSSTTLISSFYDTTTSKDMFCNLNHVQAADPFSPTMNNPFSPTMNNPFSSTTNNPFSPTTTTNNLFSPTPANVPLSFPTNNNNQQQQQPANRRMSSTASMEEYRRQTASAAQQTFQLMRSLSCTGPGSKSTVPSIPSAINGMMASDSVFSNGPTNGIGMGGMFDINGNDGDDCNGSRDRAFSENDKGPRSQNSNRYKTEMCRPYEENGKCKYGDKCQFAHGGPELRNLQRHPKYKTEMCRTYHTVGICPYGPRCHFIHNTEERKWGCPPPPMSAAPGQGLALSRQQPRRERGPAPGHQQTDRPKLLHFSSMPLGSLGSTGDLTPPRSGCDSPSPFSPLSSFESGDFLLAALTAQAKQLANAADPQLVMSPPRGMSPPTIPSPLISAGGPDSPYYSATGGPRSAGFNPNVNNHNQQHQQQHTVIKDNVFFPAVSGGGVVDNKPPSPVGYRPPSPPDSDPGSYGDRSTSPTSSVGSARCARLPIFRVMSTEEYR